MQAGFRRLSDDPATPLAWTLVLLGLLVLSGWLLRIAPLTQILPGMSSMVMTTALNFVLLGSALLRSRRVGAPAGELPGLAGTVMLLAGLHLVELLADVQLGVDLPAMHDWVRDSHRHPGQMALPTALCFELAGATLLLQRARWASRLWAQRLSRTASALVFCIGAMALVGYVLGLERLYRWYAYTNMALHTAVGMTLLGLAMWFRQNRLDSAARRRPEARILSLGTWSLVLVAAVAGVTGAWVLSQEVERNAEDGLRATHRARVQMLAITLDLRATRGQLLSSRPDLRHALETQAPPDSELLADLLADLPAYGLTHVALVTTGGRRLALIGTPASATRAAVALKRLPGQAELIWQDGLRLRQRFAIHAEDRLIGTLDIEQALPSLDAALQGGEDRTETELCGTSRAGGLVCFPNALHDVPYTPGSALRHEPVAALAALAGASGSGLFRGTRGALQNAAYSPLGSTGLAVATSLDSAVLFASTSERFSLGFLLVLFTTTVGVLLLRAGIRPLTRALSTAEARNRAVVEHLEEGVLLLDEQARVLAANPAAAAILGVSREQMDARSVDQTGWRLLAPDGTPLAREQYPSVRALHSGRGESRVPVGVLASDGRLSWVEASTALTQLDQGRVVVLTFADVTARKLDQSRLEASEARYQQMVDQVLDYAILMLDTEGRVVSWNRGAEHIKGYTADEIMGQSFARFFTEEDRAAHLPARELAEAAQQGRCEFQGWRVRQDGSRFWGLMVLTAVRDAHGQLMGYSKVTRDLTQQHRVEQALTEAHRRVQAMIDSSPFGIVATDLDGLILAMNPVGERMTGYSREELVGKLTPAIYHDAEEIRARAEELSKEVGVHIDPGIEVFVYRARQGLREDREWTCVRKDGSRFPVQAAITALRDPDGQIVGYMGVAYDISERKRQEEYTHHIAHHDFLTGLPMRRLMLDRLTVALQRARRDGSCVALMMIDLDHFKRINDSLGHHVGDELLKAVAERLLGCVRSCDTVARMGGDEFVIVLPGIAEMANAERVARLVVEQVSLPINIGTHELHVTPSVGIAIFPEDAVDAGDLLKDADAAMYVAKTAGRGCFRVFSRDMQLAADQRVQLEHELRTALRREQLQLHYQPQVCLETGNVIGMEALLRWTHPERGPISPAVFVPVAEESGLIVPLGEWVLRQACRTARELQQRTGAPLRLAVNLSPQQFRSASLIEVIQSALNQSGLAPADLEVEITEGVLMADVDEVIQRLNQIRRLGVSIAVDDFGTGYSSLAYITRFAIDTLKIDRSFVSRLPNQPNDAAVAQAIIALSISLGFRVVAEGVETAEQLAFLRSRHCNIAQGFLLGRPGPADRFSVQGFHFGEALTEERFCSDFERFQEESRERVHTAR